MNIHPTDETLLEYLEGHLPEPEQKAIRLALARDVTLRRRLASIERSVASLRQVRRHDLRTRLRQLDQHRDWHWRWLPWLLVPGILALAWALLHR